LAEFLNALKEWLALLAPLGKIGGLIWKFWLKARIDEANDLYKKVQLIAEEFRPNGGSTLRDAINRIEASVTIQEQKTLAIIKSLPLGTWISDARGKFVDVNKSMCKIMQRTESEIRGDNWSNWIIPAEKEQVVEEWTRCITSDLNFDASFSCVLPNGKIQKVHAVAYQLRSLNGALLGFLGTLSPLGEPA